METLYVLIPQQSVHGSLLCPKSHALANGVKACGSLFIYDELKHFRSHESGLCLSIYLSANEPCE